MITSGANEQDRMRCAQLGALAIFDKPGDFPGYLELAQRLVSFARQDPH
jgi:hypothetical protein